MEMSNNSDFKILVVDDEPLIRQSLYEILKLEGYNVTIAGSGEEALDIIENKTFDVMVTDLKLPKISGIELLEKAKKSLPDMEVIIITGFGSIESAVDAMKKGAYEYVTKPINDHEIKIIIKKLLGQKNLLEENKSLKELVARNQKQSFCQMIGSSAKMQRVYQTIESVASTNATILITGESGTGKGLIARAIYECDQNRRSKPFIEISCGALSETLLESELFGHVKGAFTGAIKDKEGRFEYAHGGTIFLDEIDAFSLSLQVKLLRVLQDGVFERVGDNVTRRADTRIIVATNRNLPELVAKGAFREDLYYRINVIAIQPPSLKERWDDIDNLVGFFIEKYCKANNKKVKTISDEVKKIFRDYSWPGNVRELENAIEGAVIMAKTEVINPWDIPHFEKFEKSKTYINKELTLKKAVENPEKEHILQVLKDCQWNRIKAAKALGINRTTLYNKMKKYNINNTQNDG